MNFISSGCIFFISLLLTANISPQEKGFYIRLNQVGFLPDEMKSGVIFSQEDISSNEFTVID